MLKLFSKLINCISLFCFPFSAVAELPSYAPSERQVASAAAYLARAKRPLMIVSKHTRLIVISST